jgi:hypothetical protein
MAYLFFPVAIHWMFLITGLPGDNDEILFQF